jgi:hypothetical protein
MAVEANHIIVIMGLFTILSDREFISPTASSSYCPISVGSLHSTCKNEHKMDNFFGAGVRKLFEKHFSNIRFLALVDRKTPVIPIDYVVIKQD